MLRATGCLHEGAGVAAQQSGPEGALHDPSLLCGPLEPHQGWGELIQVMSLPRISLAPGPRAQ